MVRENGIYILKTKDSYRVKHVEGIDIFFSYVNKANLTLKQGAYVPTRVVETFGETLPVKDAQTAIEIAEVLYRELHTECSITLLPCDQSWKNILKAAKRYAKKEKSVLKKRVGMDEKLDNIQKILDGYYD